MSEGIGTSNGAVYHAAYEASAGLQKKVEAKCDACGELKDPAAFPELHTIGPKSRWCASCIDEMHEAEAVSKAINEASRGVTDAMQTYIRTLASNVDLRNPHHERLLRRAINFYAKAKLVFARDTDEGFDKAQRNTTIGNYAGLLVPNGGDSNDPLGDDLEMVDLMRDQGIQSQETFGSRMAREMMSIVPQVVELLKRQVAAQEKAVTNTLEGGSGMRPERAGAAGASPTGDLLPSVQPVITGEPR